MYQNVQHVRFFLLPQHTWVITVLKIKLEECNGYCTHVMISLLAQFDEFVIITKKKRWRLCKYFNIYRVRFVYHAEHFNYHP
jgi:hypothetical protein